MENLSRPRIEWLDTAKACGMFLVFYGHFVERVAQAGNAAAFMQQKLIYAFHMPLFVVLAGYLARSASDLPPLGAFLKRQAASRLLPVLFFSVLMMPFFPLQEALQEYLPAGPGLVKARWIDDEMCRRLSPPAEGEQSRPCRKLWESLPAPVQSTVKEGAASRKLDQEGQEAIAAALNQALARPDLFTPEDFSGASISGKDREWLAADHSGLPEKKLRGRNMDLMWKGLFPEETGGESGWSDWLRRATNYWRGIPEFAVPIWFLVCLFTLELFHFGVVRVLTSQVRIALAIPLFFAVGWLLNMNVDTPWTDIWFARESVFLYSFYLLGFLLRRTAALERGGGWWSSWPLLVVGSAVVWFTYNLNPGSRFFAPVVLINLSQHGDLFYFTVTAVAGCLAVVGLARWWPAWSILQYIGRYSLILMGLNSFFFWFVNHNLANLLSLPPSPWTVLFVCTAVTIVSLAVCLPAVWLLDRYLPQLVGRPRVQGPLLPRLVP